MTRKTLATRSPLIVVIAFLASMMTAQALLCNTAAYSQVTAKNCPGEPGGCTRTTYYNCFTGSMIGGTWSYSAATEHYESVGTRSVYTFTETMACSLYGNECGDVMWDSTSDCFDHECYSTVIGC